MEQQKRLCTKKCGCCGKKFTFDRNENKWRGVCDRCRQVNNQQVKSWRNDMGVVNASDKKHPPSDLVAANAIAKYYGMSYGNFVAKYDYETRAQMYKHLKRALRKSAERRTQNEWPDAETNNETEREFRAMGDGEQKWGTERTTNLFGNRKMTDFVTE